MDESTGGPLPAPAEAEVSPLLPNVKGYEEFTVLSSTKQNIELYKLLRAISKEIQTLKTSVETRMSDLEMMIADAKDDVNVHRQILSVVPKQESPTKSTLPAFANDPTLSGSEDTFDERAKLRSVARFWQTAELTSNGGNGGKGDDDGVEESVDLLLLKNKDMERIVILNVGGKRYEVAPNTVVLISHVTLMPS